jgi:hypothetical protein
MSAGSVDGTLMGSPNETSYRPSRSRRIAMWRIREPVFAANVAGPAGMVVHAPNRRTGIPSGR